ncbi:MAG: Flp family type IVb pilin [Parasphingorhabdus sp.]|uniref:Flp family type IVb pilin n=1 Tax=Parasphingorhabdus sp. TaxID=2709688 RepID=UPI0032994D8D
MHLLKKLYRSEQGATAVEYGLILALIAITAIVAISGVANSTVNMWNTVADEVTESS